MKRISKFINIPCSLFDTPDLSIMAKWVLVAIDSVWDGNPRGLALGIQSIASMCNLKQKEVKEMLNELCEHGALEVMMVDGYQYIKPLLYKLEYKKQGEHAAIGDKPVDTEHIDYEDIQSKWEEYCPTLPPISRWTPARKAKLRSVLKNAALTVQDLYKCFQIIGCTSFLNGTSCQFKATFDWTISKSQNIDKIYSGFYSKSYQEKRDYENIMKNQNISQSRETSDDLYR